MYLSAWLNKKASDEACTTCEAAIPPETVFTESTESVRDTLADTAQQPFQVPVAMLSNLQAFLETEGPLSELMVLEDEQQCVATDGRVAGVIRIQQTMPETVPFKDCELPTVVVRDQRPKYVPGVTAELDRVLNADGHTHILLNWKLLRTFVGLFRGEVINGSTVELIVGGKTDMLLLRGQLKDGFEGVAAVMPIARDE